MYMYTYIYIYNAYTYNHTHIYIYIHTHIHIYIYIYTHVICVYTSLSLSPYMFIISAITVVANKIPESEKNTPFTRAFALQTNSISSTQAPDLVFSKLFFLTNFFSEGVFSQTPVETLAYFDPTLQCICQ